MLIDGTCETCPNGYAPDSLILGLNCVLISIVIPNSPPVFALNPTFDDPFVIDELYVPI